MNILLLSMSAFVVGFLHSLSPGHWFPVTLVSKAKRWSLKTSLIGAIVACSGHVVLSGVVGLGAYLLQSSFFDHDLHHDFEWYGSLCVILFGLIYAALHYKRHDACCHHPVNAEQGVKDATSSNKRWKPFLFLFSIGFSPCFAVLPIFASSWPEGVFGLGVCFFTFSLGVASAYMISVTCAYFGLFKLNHPVLEHYGDVISGLSVALVGVMLMIIHTLGWH